MQDYVYNKRSLFDDRYELPQTVTNIDWHDDTIRIDLWYPRVDDAPSVLKVGLMDVRAADDIRISYDFDRDGWAIQQASTFSWGPEETAYDMDWQEVAFIKAWGRKKDEA